MVDKIDESKLARTILALVFGALFAVVAILLFELFLVVSDGGPFDWNPISIIKHFKNPENEHILREKTVHHLQPWKGIWQLSVMILPFLCSLTAALNTDNSIFQVFLRSLVGVIINAGLFFVILFVDVIRGGRSILGLVIMFIMVIYLVIALILISNILEYE